MRGLAVVLLSFCLVSGPAQAGLVSHFTFDNAGSLGDDRGALNNDTTANIGVPGFTPVAQVGSGALDLNGSAALVVPNAPQYSQLDDNGEGFTMAAWVNRDNTVGPQRIFSLAMGGGFVPAAWGAGFRDANLLATTYGLEDYDQPTAVPTGSYQHVAYTYSFNGTDQIDSVKFYLNGVEVGNVDSGPDGMNNVGGGQFTIGNLNLPGALQFFNGDIDDLRVYNQELSPNRIADLAAGGPTGTIVAPTFVQSASANLNVFSSATPDNLTNNSGLDVPVITGNTLDDAEVAVHNFNGGFGESYVTNASTPDYFGSNEAPVLVWDLGSQSNIEDILLWQYQNNGGNGTSIGNHTQTFELRFSDSLSFSGSPAFTGTMANVAQLGGLNLAQTFNLADVAGAQGARFVELTLTDNYFGEPGITGGGDRIGLGEIRFNVSSSEVIPEPATLPMVLAGFLAVARTTQRRKRS